MVPDDPLSGARQARGTEVSDTVTGAPPEPRPERAERPRPTVSAEDAFAATVAQMPRFQREALITARLQHRGIVRVYEAGRWPTGEPFFAMKLVSGRPLDRVIAETRTIADRLELLPRIAAAADAIAYAHSHRVV